MLRRSFVAALLAPWLASPAAGTAGPLRLTGVLGREVELEKPAERAVVGFCFEELTAAAGAEVWDRPVAPSRHHREGGRVAGWKRSTAAIPRIAGLEDLGSSETNSFSVETVLALEPELLISPIRAVGPRAGTLAPLEAAKIPIPVVDDNAQRLENHLASTIRSGTVFGRAERAKTLAAEYEAVCRDTARPRRPPHRPRARGDVELARAGDDRQRLRGHVWGRSSTGWGRRTSPTAGSPRPGDRSTRRR